MNFSQDVYVNIIFWDNDKSLFTFLKDLSSAVEEGRWFDFLSLLDKLVTECETVFTGDEIIIVCPVFLWQFDYDVDYEIDNQYVIDEDDNGPYDELEAGLDVDFGALPQPVKDDLVQKATDGDPTLVYLMNDTAFTSTKGALSRFFYLIQQIYLKKFYVNCPSLGTCKDNIEIDIDIVSVRHLLFRVALYNDTDGNGLMDVSFNET
ncbi:MAG: hypothetical protein ACFFD2_25205, partial [Promethearchaeota archaeon]